MNENLELRRFLAEKLFGASILWDVDVHAYVPAGGWAVVPAYESTYDGMGAVIERMRAKGWSPSLGEGAIMPWNAGFSRSNPNYRPDAPEGSRGARFVVASESAATAPLAVALAAKAAIESTACAGDSETGRLNKEE